MVLNRRDGQPGAVLCAIRFSAAARSAHQPRRRIRRAKQQALQEAIAEHYQTLYQAACDRRERLGLPLPIVATGHLTTVGVTTSDSVRDIYIGTLDAFRRRPSPADYIALGHIHRAQNVAKSEHIRYSGSPIPLSFDELGKAKSVFLVDLPAAPYSR